VSKFSIEAAAGQVVLSLLRINVKPCHNLMNQELDYSWKPIDSRLPSFECIMFFLNLLLIYYSGYEHPNIQLATSCFGNVLRLALCYVLEISHSAFLIWRSGSVVKDLQVSYNCSLHSHYVK